MTKENHTQYMRGMVLNNEEPIRLNFWKNHDEGLRKKIFNNQEEHTQ